MAAMPGSLPPTVMVCSQVPLPPVVATATGSSCHAVAGDRKAVQVSPWQQRDKHSIMTPPPPPSLPPSLSLSLPLPLPLSLPPFL